MGKVASLEQDKISLLANEIINEIDENRGEMTRLEFARLLIRSRLEAYHKNQNYLDEEELCLFIREVIEMLGFYLEFLYKTKLSNITAIP